MKILLEVIVSLLIHPLAAILAWIHILGKTDQTGGEKIFWAVVCLIWGIGPLLYIFIGNGSLW